MILMHDQQLFRQRELALRAGAENERRVRAARTRDDPFDIEADVRLLLQRALVECPDCERELAREAG